MGHGWVTPNADGSVVKCGGPLLCAECGLEQAGQLRLPYPELPAHYPELPAHYPEPPAHFPLSKLKPLKHCLVYCGPERCDCIPHRKF